MKGLSVATIVEGHGEETAVPRLLHRIAQTLAVDDLRVIRPIRQKRDRLIEERFDDLVRAGRLASLKLAQVAENYPQLILLIVDSEGDCGSASDPLGPKLLRRLREAVGNERAACVVAHVMFETWVIAGLTREHPLLKLQEGEDVPADPEGEALGKPWVRRRMPEGKYRETADQAAVVQELDVAQARERSRSFDKLCRVLEVALLPTGI